MIGWILAEGWPYLLTVFGVIAGAFGFYVKGRNSEKAKQESRDLRGYIETQERMDEADIVGDDPDAARRWLSERDANKR